jgi:hypothetical protein
MCVGVCRLGWISLLCITVVSGCSSSQPVGRPVVDEEGAVREKFAEVQSALKSRDAEKLWSLLDARSRADAERIAKDIRTAHNQAGAEEKAKQEEALGLSGTELAELDGKGFLKTKRFHRKYHEVPESEIDKVVVQGESATVFFLEPDGDKEKGLLVRQDGQWKVWLIMPRISKP